MQPVSSSLSLKAGLGVFLQATSAPFNSLQRGSAYAVADVEKAISPALSSSNIVVVYISTSVIVVVQVVSAVTVTHIVDGTSVKSFLVSIRVIQTSHDVLKVVLKSIAPRFAVG
jgi:hypothetical protein